ncbi:flavin reductase family protein [Clostridium akagii]|uniref:flavin reductase family protein n=1 Tax=Clostridium akagii TaxID=91623 RepID=UPI00047C5248|nr:flavin reductase [Clostridium akagii]
MTLKEIKVADLNLNPFTTIRKEWLVVAAGNKEKVNAMTASWGGLGIIWNKNVATIYIRPQRYTKEFIDREDTFSLTVYDEKYRAALNLLGSVSGRDEDKIKESKLTVEFQENTPYFEEAKVVLICRKLYHTELKPENFDVHALIDQSYTDNDYHTMYIAEIIKAYVKSEK